MVKRSLLITGLAVGFSAGLIAMHEPKKLKMDQGVSQDVVDAVKSGIEEVIRGTKKENLQYPHIAGMGLKNILEYRSNLKDICFQQIEPKRILNSNNFVFEQEPSPYVRSFLKSLVVTGHHELLHDFLDMHRRSYSYDINWPISDHDNNRTLLDVAYNMRDLMHTCNYATDNAAKVIRVLFEYGGTTYEYNNSIATPLTINQSNSNN